MATLVFIDTNVFLDFYRARGSRDSLNILRRLDQHHDRLITGDQVRMEFTKNRQKIIFEAYSAIKKDTPLTLPSILVDSKHSKALKRTKKSADKLADELKQRLGRILRNPRRSDAVYRVTHRLFENRSVLNLSRDKAVRTEIRKLAEKRFFLGYPPRKGGDTSIGDAINWEWIVHLAREQQKDIVIVSRDSDYGVTFDNESILNDWLAEEFRSRVGRQRKIALTTTLSEGLKIASVPVPRVEQVAEQALLDQVLITHATYETADRNALARWAFHFGRDSDAALAEIAFDPANSGRD